jgi:hypothetical protein
MRSKLTNLLSITALSCAIFMASCKKEISGPIVPASSAQDKTNLTTAASAIGDNAVDILKTPGSTAIVSATATLSKKKAFGKLENSFQTDLLNRIYSIYNYGKKSITKNNAYNKSVGSSTPFDFNSKVGTYTYSSSDSSWSHNPGGSKIVIMYPANYSQGNSTNNAVLTVDRYTEINVATDTSHDYLPTAMNANLTVDGAKVAGLDFTASYNPDGTPTALMLRLSVNPYLLSINFTNQGATMVSDISLTKTGAVIFGFGATVNFMDASQKKVNTVNGAYLQLTDIKLAGDINANAIDKANASTFSGKEKAAILNQNVNVAISYKGSQVGILDFEADSAKTSSNTVPYIKFNDGSIEKLSEYFKPVTDKISSRNQ